MSKYIKLDDAIKSVADQYMFEASIENPQSCDDIKEWEKVASRVFSDLPTIEVKGGDLEDAVLLTKDAYSDLCLRASQVNTEPKHGKWVPVSERLPEDGYWLWSAVGGEVKKDFYWRGHWELAEKFGYEVVAWMPLPEPYRESEE